MAAVITEVLGEQAALAGRIRAIDPLPLTSEERASPHGSFVTAGGRRLRVSLPRGCELEDGAVLVLEEGLAVVVRAAPEDLLVVAPGDALQWGLAGFQLGNLHRPVRFTEAAMLTPWDPMVVELLTRLGIAFERRAQPFVGRRYGAVGGHHHHDHDHGHHHHHHHHGG